MTNEGETEGELAQPGFGDGKPEEKLGRFGGGWIESLADGIVGLVELLVDELAADVVMVGQGSDGLSGECVQDHLLPCRRGQQRGCGGKARCGRLG